MCDAHTLDIIREVVNGFVDDDRMFSAFDVSLTVQRVARKRGEGVERHRDMKNSIHSEVQQYLDSNLYEKVLRDVGAPTKAFVYYPEGSDPGKYEALTRRDAAPAPAPSSPSVAPAASPAPSTTATGTAVADDDDDDEGDQKASGHKADARGTLAVPSYLVRQAGFQAGGKAYIYEKDGGVVVTTQKSSLREITSYTVDKYLNIRITKGQLIAGGAGDGTYDLEFANPDEVLITAHGG
jgi:hypothetical protein